EALDRVDGSIAEAARAVGVNRNSAYGWARKAGIRGRGNSETRRAHPRKAEYGQLRAQGMPRRSAAERVGVNARTAKDWDRGVKKTRSSRTYPDGRRVDYNTGMTTQVEVPVLPAVEAVLHPRYLTLEER